MTISYHGVPPEAITRRLASGERLIWWDRPDPVGFAKRDLNFGTLFGVFFFLFAIFWMTQASRAPGPFFLFGVPFVLVGLWMVSTPLRAYWSAGRTVFALTDRRALILTGGKVAARPLEHMSFVETEAHADGRGDVLFLNEPASYGPDNWNNQARMRKSGFIAVADAERVAHEMLKLMEARRTSANPALPGGPQ
jgi:hypothetical protein